MDEMQLENLPEWLKLLFSKMKKDTPTTDGSTLLPANVESNPLAPDMGDDFFTKLSKFSQETADRESGAYDEKLKNTPSPTWGVGDVDPMSIFSTPIAQNDEEKVDTSSGLSPEQLQKLIGYSQSMQYGVDTPSALFQIGRYAAQDKGTKGKGLGMAAGITKGILGSLRPIASGYSSTKASNETMETYLKRLKELGMGDYKFMADQGFQNKTTYKDGGEIDSVSGLPEQADMMTGSFEFGLPEQLRKFSNAELEDKEYILAEALGIRKVVGKTHEKGGVPVMMQQGTRVLSDNMTVGGAADKVADAVGVKVKTKDTYAKVLDNFSKKVGVDRLIEDEEEIFEKLLKQDKIDAKTAEVNTAYLASKLEEIKPIKEVLDEKRKVVFNGLYELQENQKTTKEYQVNNMKEIDKKLAEAKKKDIFAPDYAYKSIFSK